MKRIVIWVKVYEIISTVLKAARRTITTVHVGSVPPPDARVRNIDGGGYGAGEQMKDHTVSHALEIPDNPKHSPKNIGPHKAFLTRY